MELKIEELEGEDNKTNYVNYWSNINELEMKNEKKSKISYDDILSSLNMVVNNGVLQFAKPINKQQQSNKQEAKRVTINAPNNQQPQYSYITNKYFKDYKEEVVVEQQVPLTKEEYKQMLIQDYINRQEAQRRISQIKSRKLLFDTRNINVSPNQMPRDMNKLFKSFTRK